MTMGVGAALMEELVVDRRIRFFVNHDRALYVVPVHADIPHAWRCFSANSSLRKLLAAAKRPSQASLAASKTLTCARPLAASGHGQPKGQRFAGGRPDRDPNPPQGAS